jgi:hypothetical protein
MADGKNPMPRVPKPNGRPPFAPTDSQRQIVQVLRSNGIPQRTIAANIGCDVGTLGKHFRVELKLLDRASPSIPTIRQAAGRST